MKSNVKPGTESAVVDGTRGEKDLFQGLAIKPLTRRLVNHLLLDQPLEPILIVDFGVESADHYRALKPPYLTTQLTRSRTTTKIVLHLSNDSEHRSRTALLNSMQPTEMRQNSTR